MVREITFVVCQFDFFFDTFFKFCLDVRHRTTSYQILTFELYMHILLFSLLVTQRGTCPDCLFTSLENIALPERVLLFRRNGIAPRGLISVSVVLPGRVAQSVGRLTRKSGVLGSIPGLATYFRFSFRFFKKGSCQLLAKVCARRTG